MSINNPQEWTLQEKLNHTKWHLETSSEVLSHSGADKQQVHKTACLRK